MLHKVILNSIVYGYTVVGCICAYANSQMYKTIKNLRSLWVYAAWHSLQSYKDYEPMHRLWAYTADMPTQPISLHSL